MVSGPLPTAGDGGGRAERGKDPAVMDLALPTARDLEHLPDGTTIEVARADAPSLSYEWVTRPTRVPFVRFWLLRRTWRPDEPLVATSEQLFRILLEQVVSAGDLAYPLVTLPTHPGVDPGVPA